MSLSRLDTGRFTSAQLDTTHVPRVRRSDLPAVVYLHGAAASATEAAGATIEVRRLVAALADAGFPVVAPTATETWGNATCDTRIADALTYARSTLGATVDPPVLVGSSHGGCCVLDYATDHSVACVVGVIPAVDLTYLRDNNVLSKQAAINTAWGTSGTNPLPAGADPALQTAALSAVPIQLWYSTDDTVSTNVSAFASATGAELHSLGALGHTGTAIGAVTAADVVAFVAAHT